MECIKVVKVTYFLAFFFRFFFFSFLLFVCSSSSFSAGDYQSVTSFSSCSSREQQTKQNKAFYLPPLSLSASWKRKQKGWEWRRKEEGGRKEGGKLTLKASNQFPPTRQPVEVFSSLVKQKDLMKFDENWKLQNSKCGKKIFLATIKMYSGGYNKGLIGDQINYNLLISSRVFHVTKLTFCSWKSSCRFLLLSFNSSFSLQKRNSSDKTFWIHICNPKLQVFFQHRDLFVFF